MYIVNGGIVLILGILQQINMSAKLKIFCFEIRH